MRTLLQLTTWIAVSACRTRLTRMTLSEAANQVGAPGLGVVRAFRTNVAVWLRVDLEPMVPMSLQHAHSAWQRAEESSMAACDENKAFDTLRKGTWCTRTGTC